VSPALFPTTNPKNRSLKPEVGSLRDTPLGFFTTNDYLAVLCLSGKIKVIERKYRHFVGLKGE